MDKKKKEPNWFMRLLVILFFVYLSLTIAMQMGYHEAKLNEQATLTEESIRQFEEDVKNGKAVDIDDYVVNETKDYSNGMSKAGANVSKMVEGFMTNGIGKMFDLVKSLVT